MWCYLVDAKQEVFSDISDWSVLSRAKLTSNVVSRAHIEIILAVVFILGSGLQMKQLFGELTAINLKSFI